MAAMRDASPALRSELAASWVRGGRWTPSWLAAALPRAELHVKAARRRQGGRGHFMYVGERRPDLLPDAHDCGTGRRVVAASEFFAAIEQRDAPSVLYLAAPLAELPGLLQHAPGWETLPGGAAAAATAAPMAQLWAASAGAVTQCHYDVADNTFVQLSGEKEFLLWPPEAHWSLHLFPDCHPRSRKAQLDVERPDRTLHPLSAALPPPMRLVLSAGDVLRLPAFWMHHVTSLAPTVSLNVFADYSGVREAAADALRLDVPLHAAWPDELKRRGLAALLLPVLAAARGGAPPAPFLRGLLESRFEPLAATAAAAAQQQPPPPPQRPPRRRRVPSPPSWAELEPALHEAAADGVRALERLRREAGAEAARGPRAPSWAALGDAADATHPRGVLELTAAHLAELCALRLFGAARVSEELAALAASCDG